MQRRKYLVAVYEDHGWLSAAVAAVLALAAWPLALVYSLVGKSRHARGLIDGCHVASLACTAGLLGFVNPASAAYWLWPTVRIADTVHAFFRAFATRQRPRSVLRAVVLLFVHYCEVVLLFGCLVLYVQVLATDTHLFVRNSTPQALSKPQAAYYSFVTAATIGFGDITPNHDARYPWTILVYSLVWLKTIAIFIIVIIELPRLFVEGLRE